MSQTSTTDRKLLFKIAFICSIAMLIIIPIQILVFSITRIPSSIQEWFELFNTNLLVGLFHSDLFILINNILISVIYFALYESMKENNKLLLRLALILGYIGIAAYISSNKTFELMSLSKEYYSTVNDSERIAIIASGKVMIKSWQGTAFDSYYVLNGIALLILSLTMFKCTTYSKPTAIMGLLAAIFMTIPSTAGILGLVFSLASLVPWYIFTIMYAKVFRNQYLEKCITIAST